MASLRSPAAALTTLALLAGGLVTVESAVAQGCSIVRPGIPDFDQVRAFRQNPFTPGLPNNGNMYCVPTSTVNVLAYLTNNGYPSIGGAPQNWQVADYNFLTQGLFNVGQSMNTNAQGGTGVPGWAQGTRSVLNAYYPGKFQVSWRMSSRQYAPTAREMYEVMKRGALVTFAFGYYVEAQPNVFRRVGGHCMTLTGVTNACGPNPTIRFNDPADDQASLFTQSNFATSQSVMTPRQAFFQTGNLFQNRAQEELVGYNAPVIGGRQARVFLDCYVAIWPRFALAGRNRVGAEPDRKLAIIRPISVNGDVHDVEIDVPVPGNQEIGAMALQPDLMTAWVATKGPTPTMYAFSPSEGTFTPAGALTEPKAMAFGRYGEMYLLDGGLLKTIDVSSGSPSLVAFRAPVGEIDALAYRDSNDALYTLSLAAGALTRYATPVLADSPTASFALPAGVEIVGDPSMAVGPDGSVFVTGSGNAEIYRLTFNDLTLAFDLTETISHTSIASPRSLQVDSDGRVTFSSNGVLRQLAASGGGGGGGWVELANPDLDGRTGDSVVVSLDRDNYDPEFTDADDINILPAEQPLGEPECPADFNLDGIVDFFDYLDYATCFEGDGCPRFRTADTTEDGFVDFFDYDAFVTIFEQGC
jgi:hypothetical protein